MRCPYWVDESVAGCHLPCPEEARRLARVFTHFVVLVEEDEVHECWGSFDEYLAFLRSSGVTVLHLPTPDMGAPDLDEACRLVEEVVELSRRGARVLFHCYAGLGRTGTMLAAYLVRRRCVDWLTALREVRRANPAAGPQSYAQELFLEAFERECGCGGR